MDLFLGGFPDNFKIVIFNHGKEISRYPINKNHQLHEFLLSFLQNNQKEWAQDLTTYAPVLLMNSEKFKINFLFKKKLVVVNYENKKGNWLQVSKHIEDIQIKTIKNKFVDDK
jgi:hypothetical protein